MPNDKNDAERVFLQALRDIRAILDSTHPTATPGEKIVRIGWVIGALSNPYRDTVIGEAQNRVLAGWVGAIKPTEFK